MKTFKRNNRARRVVSSPVAKPVAETNAAMTNPNIQIVLDRLDKLDGQLDQLHSRLTEHVARDEAKGDSIESLMHAVYGNGNDGIKIKVDRLVQWQSTWRWMMATLVGLAMTLFGTYGFPLLLKWIK